MENISTLHWWSQRIQITAGRPNRLVSPFAPDHDYEGLEEYLEVKHQGAIADIAKIHSHHVIEANLASSLHLPESGDPGLYFKYPPEMPRLIFLSFIRQRRPRPDQAH